ncbi:MAG: SpoIIE family protein phosphatase [Coriobacteriia bacterium]|nr:SpoIIE family protein phosphatase [Coriobacteriia bacterium]
MGHSERGRLRLTNRLVLLVALVVLMTTLLLVMTSAMGVYRMAVREQAARHAAYSDVLVAELSSRLSGAIGVLRTAAQDIEASSGGHEEYHQILSGATLGSADYFEGMVLVDSSGTVIVAWPESVLDSGDPRNMGAMDTSPTVSPFVWDSEAQGATSEGLWAVVAVGAGEGSEWRLMGRLRAEFVEQALTDVSELPGSPIALVFDDAGQLIYQRGGGQWLGGASAEFTADVDGESSGLVSIGGNAAQVGAYSEVTSPRGLGWRVAVVDSPSLAWRETWSALMPAGFGWLAALVLALITSLAVVSRVTQPLKQLERRARALASGLPVEPEAVVDHDEIGRLLEAFNSVVRRLNRLNDIAELLARASDRSLVLSGITSAIAHMLGSVDAEVLLLAGEGNVELVAAEGALAAHEGTVFDTGEVPWIGDAITTGQPVEAPRKKSDPFLELHGEGAVTALAAPLRAGSEIIGVAVVVRRGSEPFTDAEFGTVRTFAAQASVALQNARLFEEERRSRREAQSLRMIAERIASPGDVDSVLFDIARMEAELLGFGTPVVVLGDRAAYGLQPPEEAASERAWIAAWEAVTCDSEASTDPVYVDSRLAHPEVSRVLRHNGASAALMTPLFRARDIAGLLVLLATEPHGAPSRRRMALAGTVGKQASLALENAYLYQQAKNRADNLETIFRISHAVGSSLQSRIVLNRVLDVVQKILSADAVMLMTYDAQRKCITVPMARGILHRDMLEATFRLGEDVPGRVFETREPERYDRISSADTRLLNSAAEQGLESLLAVPLLARGRSIGVLVVFAREPAAFTTDELDLLRTFASQAALAIDTADMFSREHSVSMTLQESILPTKLPRIAGIEASSVYLPAGKDADIGGDYYDLFTAPDGRVVVSIGDVCGKGVSAATKTSMIRYSVRGMVAAGMEPGGILAEVNRMLLEVGDSTSIVTLWLGYVDIRTGLLVYADGGHPPGLLLNPSNNKIERLSTTGALLGAVAEATWSQDEVRMERGATLLLYTDGVTEARRGVRFFGEGRVRRALRAGGPASTVAQRLLAQVQRFSSGELRDDAAILAIAWKPTDADASGVTADEDSGK